MAEVPLPTPTQAPVPSTDIRNAVFAGAKLDEEVTGSGEFYTDRLGIKRLTNTGRNNQFNAAQQERADQFQQFLLSSGYVFLGDYEDGPFQFSARNQYIRYNDQYYRLNATTDVGFTTTGTDAISFANDVAHFVLMDGDTLRQNLGSGEGTKLIVAPGNGGTLYDLINGQLRSLFYYLSPAKIASVIGGVATDITAELQAAMNDNRPVWLPAGQYYVTASIAAAANSSLIGPGPRLASIDNRSSSHLFIIGAGGYLRGWKLWKGFSITASGNNTADAYAFYYSDRQDANGAPVYTIAQVFSEIEINAYGKLGGGWYLQECFRVVIRDCGATGLSQPFRLVGSVVQTTIDNFVQNGDGAVAMTGRSYTYGLTTEKKTYGNGSIFTPEGLTVVNTRFVKQDIGVRVEGGLYLVFDSVEADYSKYKGFWYDGGSQASFDNCYVGAQSYRDGDFVGFDIPARAAGVAEAVNVRGCTVNMSVNTHESASLFTSYGVKVGDSSVGQKGALIDGCTFRGAGYDAGIYVYRGASVSINNNRFQYSGVNISVAECTNLVMIGNSGNGAGKYILNSSSTVATWTVLNNTEPFESVTNANPNGLVAKNPGYNSATLRRIERVSSPVNVTVASGTVYQHAAPATIPLAASVEVGGAIPAGLLFSAAPASTSLIRATFFNPTGAAITLSTTIYFDITHPN
ncbi:right-handed parallel beta-helix repeat-containing protein [Raoultella ornithinolytica]|uniref:right-handed parallel beta-helix repeat-containing protein n=1 Tax=Raoultella ornithinolytica TaxID=54291 RepID=UPI00374F41AF